jgi:hypothetical protein
MSRDVCAKPGCGKTRRAYVHINTLDWDHDFVEPHPAEVPTGDEAAVDVSMVLRQWKMARSNRLLYIDADFKLLADLAFAAGREAERKACETVLRRRAGSYRAAACDGSLVAALDQAADAIAARGRDR